MDLSLVASLVGDALAAAAVILATIELRRSDRRSEQARLDQTAARRIDFQLEQLVAMSESMHEFGRTPPAQLKLRVRLLPPGMVPTAEQWVETGDAVTVSAWQADYTRALEAAIARGEGGLELGAWARARVQREIAEAVDHLLQGRVHLGAGGNSSTRR